MYLGIPFVSGMVIGPLVEVPVMLLPESDG